MGTLRRAPRGGGDINSQRRSSGLVPGARKSSRTIKRIAGGFVAFTLIAGLLSSGGQGSSIALGRTAQVVAAVIAAFVVYIALQARRARVRMIGGIRALALPGLVAGLVAIPTLFGGSSVAASPVVTDNFNDNRRDSALWNASVSGSERWETPDGSSLDIIGDIGFGRRLRSRTGDFFCSGRLQFQEDWEYRRFFRCRNNHSVVKPSVEARWRSPRSPIQSRPMDTRSFCLSLAGRLGPSSDIDIHTRVLNRPRSPPASPSS